MGDTPGSQTISTQLQRIAQQARDYPETKFNNLYHLINRDLLREANRQTRKDAAPGVDKITAAEYAKELESNLADVHQRLRERRYVAPLVERYWIEEDTGKKRPIGLSTYEDKVVQRSVGMLMSAIYDQDFYEFSHGFIKGRNQHKALVALRKDCMEKNIGWIIDADVSGFFDNLDHRYLRGFVAQRINDGGINQLIGKWLNAGVLDGESITYPETGTPQGSVVSPLLANIYLHHVLDDWFVKEVKPRVKGQCFIERFADDFIIGCELESEARRIMEVLSKRFNRFGLSIHPTKTKMIEFGRPSRDSTTGGKGTVSFLGFTHYWAKSRWGNWVIKRKTEGKRQSRFMKRLWQWCKINRHEKLKEQHQQLSSKLRGYYQYYGIRCNFKALEVVYEYTEFVWRYWLSRRSHKSKINWQKYKESILMKLPLPPPRIVHSI